MSVQISIRLKKAKETKGTVVYEEVDTNGTAVDRSEAAVPTLYITKGALGEARPEFVVLQVEEEV